MLGGNGLSAEFHFYDPIPEMTKRTNIIHNGYIYFFYRIGAPLTLVYLFVMVATFLKAFELSKQTTDPFFKKLAVTGFMTMLMLFIVNTTSSQFVYRDGIFVVAFGLAATALAEKYQRKSNTPV
jgi:O-antigen ligase